MLERRRGADRAAVRPTTRRRACDAIPRVLVELLLSAVAADRAGRLGAHIGGRLQSVRCADGSARRPYPSTVTRCRSSQWTGRWSRSRTTSPSSCASPAGRPTTMRSLREDTIWWVALGPLPILVLSRVYQRRWRYVGQRDYEAVVRAAVLTVLLTFVGIEAARPVYQYHPQRHRRDRPADRRDRSCSRCSRSCSWWASARSRAASTSAPLAAFRGGRKGERTVLIAGAGEGGRMVCREIMRNRELGLLPVGFLDDDPLKLRLRIDGVRVRGNTEGDLPRILDEAEPDEVIIAIPSAPGSTRARIVRECRTRGIPCARCRPSSSCCRRAARSRVRCARCASRTCSAASRCTWSSSGSARTSAARSCS